MQTVTSPHPGTSSTPAPPGTPPPGQNGRSAGQAQAGRRSRPLFVLYPEDGIVTVLLLAAVVYTTIASVQAVTPPWAPGMQILSPITLLGLLVGYVAVQQRFIPSVVVHTTAVVLGCLLAFWQTAAAVLGGDRLALLGHLRLWLHQALTNQRSNDNTIFLLFLGILSFLLAYLSVWLVIHARRPWLATMANGVVLLINLNFASPDELVFLIIFLLAALLLLVRFTLAENMRVWRARRLRFSPDLSWDFLQAGALLAVAVLLLAYLLPAAGPNPTINAVISNPNTAWSAIERRWETLFGSLNGPGQGGIGFFSQSLQLVGNVNLPNTEILRYTSDEPGQYLVTNTFDTYDGHAVWTQSLTQSKNFPAGSTLPSSSTDERIINQAITLTVTSNGQRNLFAAGEPAAFSLPSFATVPVDGGSPTGWYSQQDLVNGQHYGAQSYLSNATPDQLRAVPFPNQAPIGAYPASVLKEYATTDGIAPEVAADGSAWAGGAQNPYDALTNIEAQLKTFTFSYHNGTVPSNQDAVVWFLHTKKGFCTFFASTLALMARALGMPARIATGFTYGTYDSAHHDYVVRGIAAHAWTQIYFAGYGWVNFEPTQTFNEFARGNPAGTAAVTPTPSTGAGGSGARVTPTPRFRGLEPNIDNASQTSPTSTAVHDLGVSLAFLVALLLLVAAAFVVWWRGLYRGLPPVAGAFARTTRLGAWSGRPPQRDQTPYEYADRLGEVVPDEREALHRLAELYVDERWGGIPASKAETASLYERIRASLTRAIIRRVRGMPASWPAHLEPLRARLERAGERIDRLIDAPFEHR